MSPRKAESERRRWDRLPLAIPVFVRSTDDTGKEFLEFATAWNVSAGGASVAVKRSLRLSSQVSLEIPSAPVSAQPLQSKVTRNLVAEPVWVTHADSCHVVGLKFLHPLAIEPSYPSGSKTGSKRKVASLK